MSADESLSKPVKTGSPHNSEKLTRLQELKKRAALAKKKNTDEVLEEKRYLSGEGHVIAAEKRRKLKELGVERLGRTDDTAYLQESASSVQRREEKQLKKSNESQFAWNIYNADATYRHFEKKEGKTKVNMKEYHRQKDLLGDSFYATDTVNAEKVHQPTGDVRGRLTAQVEDQEKKRKMFQRRRVQYVDEENVDYINERNRNFNKKLERTLGDYSAEIKANLERGTAL